MSEQLRPDTEARSDATPPERATSHLLDPRRDGHVWPDLGVSMPGAEVKGREFEGGALKCAASEAREHLSLTISRLIETRLSDRGRFCDHFSVIDSKERRYHRLYCNTWGCSWCGPRKAKKMKWAIRVTAEAHGLSRFVSLTLDPKLLNNEDSVRYLNQTR